MIDEKTISDKKLVTLIQQGSQPAFAELYERYKSPLYLHACRMLNDGEEAKDIVQDTFAAIWAKRETLEVNTTINSYLYGSVRNRILDLISHSKVVAKYTDSLESFLETSTRSHDHKIIEGELLEMFEFAVASLPEKMREVFELSRKEGLSHKNIALRLNISDKTVKKQISNAIKMIRLKVRMLFFTFF